MTAPPSRVLPNLPPRLPPINYLAGYAAELQAQVQDQLAQGTLGERLQRRYAEPHGVRTDGMLYDYTMALKNRHLRNAEPLSKVVYDNRLHVIRNALGTHTTVSRVQGSKLKAKREIRIAGLFRTLPAEFLKMIVVHELAHMKERDVQLAKLEAWVTDWTTTARRAIQRRDQQLRLGIGRRHRGRRDIGVLGGGLRPESGVLPSVLVCTLDGLDQAEAHFVG